jgi:hypothetical protein
MLTGRAQIFTLPEDRDVPDRFDSPRRDLRLAL